MKKLSFIFLFYTFLQVMHAQILDIKVFLNQCPTNDTAIATILSDFEIRLNSVLVNKFPCTEPISTMNVKDYTDQLIALQTLRTIYYMDRNMKNHLPWTNQTLYNWMKANIAGVNIKDGVSGGYCCEIIDGKKFFVMGTADDFNREFDKTWRGIAGNIDFFVHEVRHTNGGGYHHTSCCGINYGCDDVYDENDLGAYGVQYWLNKNWLTGYINVGARSTGTEAEINDIIAWHFNSANSIAELRFCKNPPAILKIEDIKNPLGSANNLSPEIISDIGPVLFPNPVKLGEVLTLNMKQPNEFSVFLYSTNGLLYKKTYTFRQNQIEIPTTGLTKGLYLIKIIYPNGKANTMKVIIF